MERVPPSHLSCLCYARDKLVYFWSMGSYLLYNATTAEENHRKPTSFTLKRGAPLSAILLILTTDMVTYNADGIFDFATLTVHFDVKSSVFVSVCSLS